MSIPEDREVMWMPPEYAAGSMPPLGDALNQIKKGYTEKIFLEADSKAKVDNLVDNLKGVYQNMSIALATNNETDYNNAKQKHEKLLSDFHGENVPGVDLVYVGPIKLSDTNRNQITDMAIAFTAGRGHLKAYRSSSTHITYAKFLSDQIDGSDDIETAEKK